MCALDEVTFSRLAALFVLFSLQIHLDGFLGIETPLLYAHFNWTIPVLCDSFHGLFMLSVFSVTVFFSGNTDF